MNDPDKGATIAITREELHRRAWETPPHELAQEFGITRRRLIEIFIKLAVPYPRRLYWRRKTAGKPVIALNLTSPPQDTPQYIVIEPTLPRRSPHEGSVPWHPLIASWHKERARLRALPPPYGTALDWTPLQLRQHKILDMIFKAVQKDGLVPRDARREKGFIFQYQSIEILCSLTEKKRRIQEPRVRTSEFVFVLKPTGNLVFKIERCFANNGRREWLEEGGRRLEAMVPEIISSIREAAPASLRLWQIQQEQTRKSAEVRERREVEAKRRQIDRNRWEAFIEYGHRLTVADQLEKFIRHLECTTSDFSVIIDGRPISDWLRWARSHLEKFDPRLLSTEAIFAEIAERRDSPRPEKSAGL
jgi:hypothetical protein